MLPSSIIGASSEASERPRTNPVSVAHGVRNAERIAQPLVTARGPLARSVLRLLGIGADQSYASWAHNPTQAALGGPGAQPFQHAWITARILPTPSGYYRAQEGPLWRL